MQKNEMKDCDRVIVFLSTPLLMDMEAFWNASLNASWKDGTAVSSSSSLACGMGVPVSGCWAPVPEINSYIATSVAYISTSNIPFGDTFTGQVEDLHCKA